MCEKPAGVYTKQVREMNEEANKHDLVFGMMFNQRTNHIYRKMHELVTGGQYGRSNGSTGLSLTGTGRRPTIIRAAGALPGRERGGGVLSNLSVPHNLDLIQWICGMPKTVQGVLPRRQMARHRGGGRCNRVSEFRTERPVLCDDYGDTKPGTNRF